MSIKKIEVTTQGTDYQGAPGFTEEHVKVIATAVEALAQQIIGPPNNLEPYSLSLMIDAQPIDAPKPEPALCVHVHNSGKKGSRSRLAAHYGSLDQAACDAINNVWSRESSAMRTHLLYTKSGGQIDAEAPRAFVNIMDDEATTSAVIDVSGGRFICGLSGNLSHKRDRNKRVALMYGLALTLANLNPEDNQLQDSLEEIYQRLTGNDVPFEQPQAQMTYSSDIFTEPRKVVQALFDPKNDGRPSALKAYDAWRKRAISEDTYTSFFGQL